MADATRTDTPQNYAGILLGFILAGLAANIYYPGEVFYQSKYLFLIVSLLVLLITLCTDYQNGNLPLCGGTYIQTFVPLLILLPGYLFTINRSRSEEILWLFLAYVCLYLTIKRLQLSVNRLTAALFFLLQLACLVNLFSLYQYFFELSKLRQLILHDGAMDASIKWGLIGRIGTQRVFAHFPLPNTLAGFITMLLPLQFFFIQLAFRFSKKNKCSPALRLGHELKSMNDARLQRWLIRCLGRPWMLALLVAQLILGLVVLAMTKSFGGWVCLIASGLLLLLHCGRKQAVLTRKHVLPALLLLVLSAGWMSWLAYSRGFALWELTHQENPIALRLINYRTAWRIFLDFPWAGVGLGNFGVMDPAYQTSNATITQYTHNTPLQLLAECGSLFLFALLYFAWRWYSSRLSAARRLPIPLRQSQLEAALRVSIIAWMLHNLIDINFYFPSLGSLGILLLAAYASLRERAAPESVLSEGICSQPYGLPTLHSDGSEEFLSQASQPNLESAAKIPTFAGRRSKWLAIIFTLALTLSLVSIIKSYLAATLVSMTLDAHRAKSYIEAREYASFAAKLEPGNASIVLLNARAHTLTMLDDPSQKQLALPVLLNAYREAIRLDPYNAGYYYELSKIQTALADVGGAEQSRSKAIQLDPTEPRFRTPF